MGMCLLTPVGGDHVSPILAQKWLMSHHVAPGMSHFLHQIG
jgi:hypothetical protein